MKHRYIKREREREKWLPCNNLCPSVNVFLSFLHQQLNHRLKAAPVAQVEEQTAADLKHPVHILPDLFKSLSALHNHCFV